MKVIIPKNYCETDSNWGPLFFLAGPVQGGGGWQTDCLLSIKELLADFYVAIPYGKESQSRIDFLREHYHLCCGKTDRFQRQLEWERYYMEIAANRGCLIFWLPNESQEEPRKDGKPYATDTRGEIGEWRGRMMFNKNLRVVVGGEDGFPGLRTIKRNFDSALKCDFPVHSSLFLTIKAALAKIRS
jgi:hypothetical protein